MPEPFDITTLNLPEDSEVYALLEACPGIEGLRFANDEFLVHGDDTAQDIYIMLRGNCLVEQADAPQERKPGKELAVICAEPDAPVFVGEMAYLGGGFRSAAVRSVMATFTLRLKPEHLDIIMERFPWFTRILCKQFALRLGDANGYIKNYQNESAMEISQHFLSPGDVLVEAGAPADKLYQLVDGLLIEKGEDDVKIGPVGNTPCFIGSREFFSGGHYPHRVVAGSSAIVLALGKSRQEAIIRNFPELALGLIREALGTPEENA